MARTFLAALILIGCGGGGGQQMEMDGLGGPVSDGPLSDRPPEVDAPWIPDAPAGRDAVLDSGDPADRPGDVVVDGAAADRSLADAGPDAADRPSSAVGDVETYCRLFAERFCAWTFVCAAQIARSTEADCVAEREAVCLQAAREWQIPGIAAGRLAFDPTAAGACLDRNNGPCGYAWTNDEPCRRVFRPLVADGGKCLNDSECIGGLCDRARSCPGVCASPGKAGADCTRYPCDTAVATCGPPVGQTRQCLSRTTGMACQYTVECAATDYCRSPDDGLPCQSSRFRSKCACVTRGGSGAACKIGEECAPDLGCAGGQCRARVSQGGEPCSYANGVDCVPGLACIITDGRRTALSGTCGPMLPEGSSCYWIECQRGLACVGGSIDELGPRQGVCRARAKPGEMCRPFGCPLGLYCEQGSCVPRPGLGAACVAIGGGEKFCFGAGITCNRFTDGLCTRPPAVGEPCWEMCNSDGYCATSDTAGVCQRKKAPGERCFGGGECASGTCSLFTCAPPCTAANL